MLALTTYLLIVILLIAFLLLLTAYSFFGLISDFKGAPFVPTYNRYVKDILAKAKLKKGQVFLELGSGDGRIVRFAVKNYQVKGVGVEIHPLLVFYCRFLARLQKMEDIVFRRENFFATDFRRANVIFIFLLPKTIEKLKGKFLGECKKGTLIISHGFKIKGFERFLADTTERKLFSTYYYRLR